MNKKNIIYQIALRTFTPEGTIKAAEDMLEYIADLGIDIIYLSACCCEDDDEDKKTWSPRQIKSGVNNPKNPYKIKDYFSIDEEYGSIDDLKQFIATAHGFGLKVLIDLVYFHSGLNAVFLGKNPNYIIRNKDGEPAVGKEWPFARLNYENPELREYLFSNMKFWIEDVNVDGFRCDIGDYIPLDFWKDVNDRIRQIKPNAIMVCEGYKKEYLETFDADYGGLNGSDTQIDKVHWFATEKDFTEALNYWGQCGGKRLNKLENHDIASDRGDKRLINLIEYEEYEQWLFLLYALDGIPFIWNGEEIADNSVQDMFSNRFYGKNNSINWSFAQRKCGKICREYIKELNKLYHGSDILAFGDIKPYLVNDEILSFTRKYKNESLMIVLNKSSHECKMKQSQGVLVFSRRSKIDCSTLIMDKHGFAIIKM